MFSTRQVGAWCRDCVGNRNTLSPVGTVSITLALQGGDNPHMTKGERLILQTRICALFFARKIYPLSLQWQTKGSPHSFVSGTAYVRMYCVPLMCVSLRACRRDW